MTHFHHFNNCNPSKVSLCCDSGERLVSTSLLKHLTPLTSAEGIRSENRTEAVSADQDQTETGLSRIPSRTPSMHPSIHATLHADAVEHRET